jgi:hypothetical protein
MTREELEMLLNAKATIIQTIDQGYRKGAFGQADSIHITIATDILAQHIQGLVENFNASQTIGQQITEETLIKALEESPDNPANKEKNK